MERIVDALRGDAEEGFDLARRLIEARKRFKDRPPENEEQSRQRGRAMRLRINASLRLQQALGRKKG